MYREPIVMGRKPRLKSTVWTGRKKEIANQKRMKNQIQKNEERVRNLCNNIKCSNIRIIGVPEGEEGEQEIENLLERIMKENVPNLAKELYMQFRKLRESQRSWIQGGTHQGTS